MFCVALHICACEMLSLLRKLRAVAFQKRSLTDACPFMGREHTPLVGGSKQGEMGEISGQHCKSLIGDNALLFLVPVLHLLSSQKGFLLHLFSGFRHGMLLFCFCFRKRIVLFFVHGLHYNTASTLSST